METITGLATPHQILLSDPRRAVLISDPKKHCLALFYNIRDLAL